MIRSTMTVQLNPPYSNWRKWSPADPWKERNGELFRHAIRYMVACHKAGTDYQAQWTIDGPVARVRIQAIDPPMLAKMTPLSRDVPKLVARPKRKVNPLDAEYSDTAMVGQKGPLGGMFIRFDSGLSLTKECGPDFNADSDTDTDKSNPLLGWTVTHTATGLRISNSMTFKSALKALYEAEAICSDWSPIRQGNVPADLVQSIRRHKWYSEYNRYAA